MKKGKIVISKTRLVLVAKTGQFLPVTLPIEAGRLVQILQGFELIHGSCEVVVG